MLQVDAAEVVRSLELVPDAKRAQKVDHEERPVASVQHVDLIAIGVVQSHNVQKGRETAHAPSPAIRSSIVLLFFVAHRRLNRTRESFVSRFHSSLHVTPSRGQVEIRRVTKRAVRQGHHSM